MSDGTKIEWTDATVNAINGCTRISPGCGGPGPHGGCYAERLAGTRMRNHPTRVGLTRQTRAGPRWTGKVRLNEDALLQPLRWKRPRRIFWNAHGDTFHPDVPDEWIDRCFAVMALTPQHVHQVLTKRADRMRAYLSPIGEVRHAEVIARIWEAAHALVVDGTLNHHSLETEALYEGERWPLPNVWPGVSVEDQTRAKERIPDLLATPAAVRWLSCEPLLGPLAIAQYLDGLDWAVAGGESGPGSRPMHVDWYRSLRDQCAAAGVPFFGKQWGDWLPEGQFDETHYQWAPGLDGKVHWWKPEPPIGAPLEDGHCSIRIGERRAGRSLDGILHDGMPA